MTKGTAARICVRSAWASASEKPSPLGTKRSSEAMESNFPVKRKSSKGPIRAGYAALATA